MKSKLLEKKKYPAVCEHCKHGRLSPDEQTVLCVKKGLVDPSGKCRRYSYDPLKRRPKKPLMVQQADPSEFDLNIDTEPILPSPAEKLGKEPEQESVPELKQEPVSEPEQEPIPEPEKSTTPEPVNNTKSKTFFEPVRIFSEDFDKNSDV